MSQVRKGGCLCGAVRYAMQSEPLMVALCHCSMCRRAAGAPAVAWAMLPQDHFVLEAGEIAKYASSDGVERGHCGRCGTQLSFEADFLPGLIDVTVASLDEPEALPPQMHMWDKARIAWLELGDAWPRHPELPPQDG